MNKQKPVIYVAIDDSGFVSYGQLTPRKDLTPLYTQPNQELLNEYWEMGYNQCLETSKKFPIPATWQSLSDDEIDEIWVKSFGSSEIVHNLDFARAIEQALKELNEKK